jgi:anti-sigma factor RsiW
MTNEDLHELTAAYALDALDDDERREFEAHLDDCAECRAELAELSGTVGALAYAAEGPAPPDELRNRILVAAREEGPSNVVALRPRRTRLYAGAALAAVAAVALAIGLWTGLSGGGSSPDKLALSVKVDGGVAQMTVTGLPDAPAGKTYEIWVIKGPTPKRAGVFHQGGKQTVTLSRPVPPGATVAITLEKAGGVEAPTSQPLVSTTYSAA